MQYQDYWMKVTLISYLRVPVHKIPLLINQILLKQNNIQCPQILQRLHQTDQAPLRIIEDQYLEQLPQEYANFVRIVYRFPIHYVPALQIITDASGKLTISFHVYYHTFECVVIQLDWQQLNISLFQRNAIQY